MPPFLHWIAKFGRLEVEEAFAASSCFLRCSRMIASNRSWMSSSSSSLADTIPFSSSCFSSATNFFISSSAYVLQYSWDRFAVAWIAEFVISFTRRSSSSTVLVSLDTFEGSTPSSADEIFTRATTAWLPCSPPKKRYTDDPSSLLVSVHPFGHSCILGLAFRVPEPSACTRWWLWWWCFSDDDFDDDVLFLIIFALLFFE